MARAKAIRFTTLTKICEVLGCQPGDLLTHVPQKRLPRAGEADRPAG
ncbi:helix-turn-helix domain-containing protein [Nonomuraea sp. NPDC050394]